MEALVLTGTNKLEVKSIEKPQVKPNEVLIHTAFA
ncbi:alcohol dehydrogenase, partial [Weissella confusa]|nr:alcohol dehydrogenase [Weissella confusa]MDY2530412.1 alcohol dehydrogenase [Weissella confusa]